MPTNVLPLTSPRAQLVLAKAIAYAVATIDALPKEKQEWSDRQDMVHLLDTYFAVWKTIVEHDVEIHTGIKPNLIDYKK